MTDKKILKQIKEIDKEKFTECCNVPKLYYIGIGANGEHYFDEWDFCPCCLEC